jgi:hypothetical protein
MRRGAWLIASAGSAVAVRMTDPRLDFAAS